jgi:hypothetical protein
VRRAEYILELREESPTPFKTVRFVEYETIQMLFFQRKNGKGT